MTDTITLEKSLESWLEMIKSRRSYNTYKVCKTASNLFLELIGNIHVVDLSEAHYEQLLTHLNQYAVSSEKLYSTMIYKFLEYLSVNEIKVLNLGKIKYMREYESRHFRTNENQREIDKHAISKVIEKIYDVKIPENDLTYARAKALVILMMESGLRVFEVCKLRRKNLDMVNCVGSVIGKGDKPGKFFFTEKSIEVLDEYFAMRSTLEADRCSKISIVNQPLFISHSLRNFKKLIPITTDTAREDLKRILALIPESDGVFITPHVFRHYFVDAVLEESQDVETARKAARHSSILTTQRYLHSDEEKVQEIHKRIWK